MIHCEFKQSLRSVGLQRAEFTAWHVLQHPPTFFFLGLHQINNSGGGQPQSPECWELQSVQKEEVQCKWSLGLLPSIIHHSELKWPEIWPHTHQPWTQDTHPSHTNRDTHACSILGQSSVRKASADWAESKYLGGSCSEWQLWGWKQATMCFKALNAWVKVHRGLHKNQTYHSRCGRCGARNECVQLKLFIYLDERWTPQEWGETIKVRRTE